MESKRYYWLRLHDDFFDSARIKKLRKMAGGDTYTIIYLKMQLVAMKKDGIIQWTGLEDSAADEIALDINESPDDVRVVLAYLLSCGLAETSDDIHYYFPYAVLNTGSETASTQRSREFRERQKALQCNTNATQMQQNCNVEKEKRKRIDREETENRREEVHRYGEYKNVPLSDSQMEKLKAEFPDWQSWIEKVSDYCQRYGKKYSDYLAVIRNWARRDKERGVYQPPTDDLPY